MSVFCLSRTISSRKTVSLRALSNSQVRVMVVSQVIAVAVSVTVSEIIFTFCLAEVLPSICSRVYVHHV